MFNWTQITFLESAENLKPRLKSLTGQTPTTAIAREVGICLQQGRLFYQSAAESALEIRPLLLFYGTMAFSKALIISYDRTPIASLPQSHGIKDLSSQGCSIADLSLKIQENGTFQKLNDVVAKLNRVDYIDNETMTRYFMAPTAMSDKICGQQLSLEDILSRIPGLEALYKRTFNKFSNSMHVSMEAEIFNKKCWELLATTKEIFHDRESLKKIVLELRSSFPILGKLSVSRAAPVWNASYIHFSNMPIPSDEFEETFLLQRDRGFQTKNAMSHDESLPYEPFQSLVNPHSGSISGSDHLISPFNGLYLSKISLHYLAMFLLSSLVRYRPQIWGYAITRSARPDGGSDDHILSLLEEFMKRHSEEIPSFVAKIFDPD